MISRFRQSGWARGQQPVFPTWSASDSTTAVHSGGYLLVVDAGLMGKRQRKTRERTLSQTLELDRAVGIARSYGGEKATIIVCAMCDRRIN